ncbi:PIG-L family deacetylase [Actinomycetospora endophytica]|uniref:PIG-L family deacetylase n=1 Tax=Actinomycetospora endophytica TaxID=2291215 RepID=A0ABS8PH86_9PSEU|nr:PIG-L deacetylase family protein [Actinomycetospora endophytica]MCD2197626.1 PIG-L family deacetylase [Actinomycetospora endophytica]
MTPRDLTGPGTDEARWRASEFLATLPRLDPGGRRPPGRVVVLAPHPDDEILGAGGTLSAWAADGVPIVVVAVTYGEASHPGSPTLTPDELALRRDDERRRALDELGLSDARIVRTGLPDGAVIAYRAVLRDHLMSLLEPGDTVLAPIPGDGHPDHDAVAEVARKAARCRGAAVWHYAVWLWHWATPEDEAVARGGAVAITLPAGAWRAKRSAVDCFTSQIESLSSDPRDAAVLPPRVLDRLVREIEVLWTGS